MSSLYPRFSIYFIYSCDYPDIIKFLSCKNRAVCNQVSDSTRVNIREPMVSIIIVNYNGLRDIKTCLSSVFDQSYLSFEVIVIDNGSSDSSVEFIENNYPQVKIIKNKKNLGFAKANNQGFDVSIGEFIATLNNDTEVDKDWLRELVSAMMDDEDIGMCGSRIMFYKHRDIINSIGITVSVTGYAYDTAIGEPFSEKFSRKMEIFCPSAAAALYRRKMIEEIGFFDEDFFAYYEDVDLAWRARLAGWKAVYVPTAVVYHRVSQTGKQLRDLNSLQERNRIWLLMKNSSLWHFLIYLPISVIHFILASLCGIFFYGDFSRIYGFLWAMLGGKKILQKRAVVMGRKRVSHSEIYKWFILYENPYNMLRRRRVVEEFSG